VRFTDKSVYKKVIKSFANVQQSRAIPVIIELEANGGDSMKTIHRDSKGNIKYYASWQSAWKAANRLNETEGDVNWVFEQDLVGWFVFKDN
jgi:hypothetical protein